MAVSFLIFNLENVGAVMFTQVVERVTNDCRLGWDLKKSRRACWMNEFYAQFIAVVRMNGRSMTDSRCLDEGNVGLLR